MDQEQVIQFCREEANKLRWKVSDLKVNSVEQRASDEVRKWRQSFETSSSHQVEQVINEMEKRKQSKVSRLAQELRVTLDQFKETNLNRLAEVDALISKANLDDEIQLNHIKIELDSIRKEIDSLHMDIVVTVIDTSSNRRGSSTALTRNSLQLAPVFEFKDLETPPSSYSDFLGSLTKFVRRASSTGASHYNVDVLEPKTYF